MKRNLLGLVMLSMFVLTGCNNYTIEVDLPEDYRQDLEATIVEYQEKIKNYDPYATEEDDTQEEPMKGEATSETEDSETAITFVNPDGTESSVSESVDIVSTDEIDPRPPFNYFLEVALAQEKLGRLGKAIKTYNKALGLYENSHVAWHNLGRIYEKVKKYDKAVTYYQTIIDQFGFVRYHLDIANAYIKKGDGDAAQKAYNQYRLLTNLTDLGTERYIYNLRQKK